MSRLRQGCKRCPACEGPCAGAQGGLRIGGGVTLAELVELLDGGDARGTDAVSNIAAHMSRIAGAGRASALPPSLPLPILDPLLSPGAATVSRVGTGAVRLPCSLTRAAGCGRLAAPCSR